VMKGKGKKISHSYRYKKKKSHRLRPTVTARQKEDEERGRVFRGGFCALVLVGIRGSEGFKGLRTAACPTKQGVGRMHLGRGTGSKKGGGLAGAEMS